MRPRARARRAVGENADGRRALEQLRPTCPCGKRFTPVRPGQRFCRPSCRTLEARREDKWRLF